jgi:cytochrome c oxidase assembly protein subunit 15
MTPSPNNPWLHRFAVLTAAATLLLLGIGGLVTSHGAGMAVPDWPTSYGYNLFLLPIQFWKGGVFYEHTHRLWASLVGVLVVGLTRWLGGRTSRKPLAVIGLVELAAGFVLVRLDPRLSGAGHFLTGIGGVVLVGAVVWARNETAARPLPQLGWLAFFAVQLQGLLGGLRVVLFQDQLGVFHATLAQLFFVLLCAIALFTSRWWKSLCAGGLESADSLRSSPRKGPDATQRVPTGLDAARGVPGWRNSRQLLVAVTALIFLQLLLGAAMRHQHAGLAISDFPLAHGRWWPATDPQSIAHYNEQRIEVTAANPITAFQIQLQMAHRILAVLIVGGVGYCVWRVRRIGTQRPRGPGSAFGRLTLAWLMLIVGQAGLGAATVLSNKAADVATAHVLAGALSLATGVMLCLLSFRNSDRIAAAMPAELSLLKEEHSERRNGLRNTGGAVSSVSARL